LLGRLASRTMPRKRNDLAMTRIAVLSTTRLPRFLGEGHPTEAGLFAEDDLLIDAFARRGARAERLAWRRVDVDWRTYDLAVIRSTWDYIDDLAAFLARLRAIEDAGCPLVNPLRTVEWNYDKGYLLELAERGLVIVPSWIGAATSFAAEAPAWATGAPEGYIVKPTVGVGAFGAVLLADGDAVARHVSALSAAERVIVQPFLPSVRDEGEWSFVFLDGGLAYTALKRPRPGEFRVQVMYGAETIPAEPAARDRAAAEAVMAALLLPARYARIDMARLPDGRLALMEAELIEPQLYFSSVPGSADRFAEAMLAGATA